MISALVLGWALAPWQVDRRDFLLPVMSVDKLGEWLGEQTGRQVYTNSEAGERLIYIHLKDRTYAELFGYLKDAVGVGILDKNGALTITDEGTGLADPALDAGVLQASLDKLLGVPVNVETLKAAIFEVAQIDIDSQSGQMRDLEKVQEKRTGLVQVDPMTQAAARFAASLGIEGMMALPDHERVVFSTLPTRLQRVWPGGKGAESIRQANAGLMLKNEALAAANLPERKVFVIGYPPTRLLLTDGGEGNEIASMQAAVTKSYYDVTVELQGFSASGDFVSAGTARISGAFRESDKYKKRHDNLRSRMIEDQEEIPITDEDRTLLKRLHKQFGFSSFGEMTPDDFEWLSKIDIEEPLGGRISEMFDQMMDKYGREGVLHISPGMFFEVPDDQMPIRRIGFQLLAGVNSEYLDDPKKVLVRSYVGHQERGWTTRAVRAESARRFLQNGRLTLEDISDLVRLSGQREAIYSLLSSTLHLTSQGSRNQSWEGYGLTGAFLLGYRGLPVPTQNGIFADGGISAPLDRYPSEMQHLVQNVVLTNDLTMPGLSKWTQNPASNGQGLGVDDERKAKNVDQTVYLTNPKFSRLSLNISGKRETSLLVQSSFQDHVTPPEAMTIEHAGLNMAASEYALSQGNTNYAKFVGFGSAVTVSVSMQLRAGPLAIKTEAFSFLESPAGETGPIEKLPEDVRKELTAVYERWKEHFRKNGLGSSQPAVKPPPPSVDK